MWHLRQCVANELFSSNREKIFGVKIGNILRLLGFSKELGTSSTHVLVEHDVLKQYENKNDSETDGGKLEH